MKDIPLRSDWQNLLTRRGACRYHPKVKIASKRVHNASAGEPTLLWLPSIWESGVPRERLWLTFVGRFPDNWLTA